MYRTVEDMRILIVDDNATFGKVLYEALGTRGCSCSIARSFGEACEALHDTTYDAVVSDLHIRERSGISLLRHVADQSPRTVRVLMSGSLAEEDAGPIADGAFDGYLRKPFELQTLCDLLDQVRRSRSNR